MANAEATETKSPERLETMTLEELRGRCMELLSLATNSIEIRQLERALVQITEKIDPDSLEGMYGIRIIARAQDRPAGESCFEYAVGHGIDFQAFHDQMFATHTASATPVPGSYALYFLFNFDIAATHIGKATDRGTVISKWGPTGYVYEHNPEMVPLSYGEPLFYVPPTSEAERS